MIIVTVHLHSANTGETTELARTYICATGEGRRDSMRGDYEAFVCRKGNFDPQKNIYGGEALRTATVKNYPRLSYNVWRLVIRALRAAFPEERG